MPLDIWRKFFHGRIGRPWNRLPREAEDAHFLQMFKVRLDWGLGQPDLVGGILGYGRRVGVL